MQETSNWGSPLKVQRGQHYSFYFNCTGSPGLAPASCAPHLPLKLHNHPQLQSEAVPTPCPPSSRLAQSLTQCKSVLADLIQTHLPCHRPNFSYSRNHLHPHGASLFINSSLICQCHHLPLWIHRGLLVTFLAVDILPSLTTPSMFQGRISI